MLLADLTAATSVISAVGGLVVTAFGYVGYQNRRDRLAAIRAAFDGVVQALASEDEKRGLAAAILLRRFFDAQSELGIRGVAGRRAPYAQEALHVMAAVLRSEPTGNLQKLLADGIAYAPDLQGVDLQKTNLQNAYLRPRREGAALDGADFFRADLSRGLAQARPRRRGGLLPGPPVPDRAVGGEAAGRELLPGRSQRCPVRRGAARGCDLPRGARCACGAPESPRRIGHLPVGAARTEPDPARRR